MNPRSATRPRLQRDDVVDRAMAMADTEGIEAVTIRRLAQELGVTPMALYWHFSDKDALLAAVSERLWEQVRTELADSPESADDWAEVGRLVQSMVAVLRRHPGCAALAPLAVLTSEAGLEVTEGGLARLARVGVEPVRAADTVHFLLITVITLVSNRPGAAPGDAEERRAAMQVKLRSLQTLSPERYPHVTAVAPFLVDCADDELYYRQGVDFVLAGARRVAGSGGRPD